MGARDKTKLGKELKNEVTAAVHIPYTTHVDRYTVKTESGDFVQVLKLGGAAHETSDIADINAWHMARNSLYKNIAGPGRALWSTIIRSQHNGYPDDSGFEPGFAKDLNRKYRDKIEAEKLYTNELYLAVIQRHSSLKGVFGWSKKGQVDQDEKVIKELNDTVDMVLNSLGRYDPERLGIYEFNGRQYSSTFEYFAQLLNGHKQRIPLLQASAKNIICNSRVSIGSEAYELRGVNDAIVGATLGIKEYCVETSPGILDDLLNLPMEFVLTQSFTFVAKAIAASRIKTQMNKLNNSEDDAVSQIDEIPEALDSLASNLFTFGDHHLTFSPQGQKLTTVKDHLAKASSVFADAGFVTALEDLGAEAAFWSRLPANFGHRTRPALINSRNFSALSSFHNYPVGHIDGNWWGPAITMLKTTANTPYFFNYHLRGDQPLGNATVVGPSGSGKSVVLGFTMAQAEKNKPRTIVIDKDRGMEIMVRAQNGSYSQIKMGVPSGFNPFRMEPNPENIAFWNEWISILIGEPYTHKDRKEVSEAINHMISAPEEGRRIGSLIKFLDKSRVDSVAERLEPWVEGAEMGWAFDNKDDSLALDNRVIGFDVTELLNSQRVRTPMLAYLFHRIQELINGEKIIIVIDEGWRILDDPIFVPKVRDLELTIRKKNGLVIFGTQSASVISSSAVGNAIVDSSPLNLFFGNSKAKREDYIGVFRLSEKEFNIIVTLPKRQCLIRHGANSVVVTLDLSGMDDELTVLSGTTANVKILDQVRAEYGDDSANWMTPFLAKVKALH